MKSALVVLLVLFMGCTSTRPTDVSSDRTEVISLAPLPPLTAKTHLWGVTLDVVFHLQSDGTVLDAKMERSSGDAEWDSLAVGSMKQWRFAPLVKDGRVFDSWIRHKLIVQVQEPIVMIIGELACTRREEADSLHSLIEKGSDFTALMMQAERGSSAAGCRCPGAVEISRYPRHIREQLKKLGVSEVTSPLRLGSNYMIYRRYPDQVSGKLPD
jgi:TonB family protein